MQFRPAEVSANPDGRSMAAAVVELFSAAGATESSVLL